MRTAFIERNTRETQIKATINLDGKGKNSIDTGIGFFDHMLTAFSVHSGIDIDLKVKGDLNVDGHHTVEDTGIVLGKAFAEAIGDKAGITRYGSAYIPMDEALSFACIDICSRPYLVFDCNYLTDRTGEYDNCLTIEFFRAFAMNALITLHIKCMYGDNDHHKIEAMFKAFAHAMKQAVEVKNGVILSSKGVL